MRLRPRYVTYWAKSSRSWGKLLGVALFPVCKKNALSQTEVTVCLAINDISLEVWATKRYRGNTLCFQYQIYLSTWQKSCFYMESFQIKISEVQKFLPRRPPYFSQRRVRSLVSKLCALRVIPGFCITQFPSSEDYLFKFKFAVETCSYFSHSPLKRNSHQGISTLIFVRLHGSLNVWLEWSTLCNWSAMWKALSTIPNLLRCACCQ